MKRYGTRCASRVNDCRGISQKFLTSWWITAYSPLSSSISQIFKPSVNTKASSQEVMTSHMFCAGARTRILARADSPGWSVDSISTTTSPFSSRAIISSGSVSIDGVATGPVSRINMESKLSIGTS
ncbi:MAG: hypothetical protein RQ826_09255 [Xanthomonadales bacterium]|nr:hypothetical protein [Xanthomonadales bacterium]